jgi:hypothetical protein
MFDTRGALRSDIAVGSISASTGPSGRLRRIIRDCVRRRRAGLGNGSRQGSRDVPEKERPSLRIGLPRCISSAVPAQPCRSRQRRVAREPFHLKSAVRLLLG